MSASERTERYFRARDKGKQAYHDGKPITANPTRRANGVLAASGRWAITTRQERTETVSEYIIEKLEKLSLKPSDVYAPGVLKRKAEIHSSEPFTRVYTMYRGEVWFIYMAKNAEAALFALSVASTRDDRRATIMLANGWADQVLADVIGAEEYVKAR